MNMKSVNMTMTFTLNMIQNSEESSGKEMSQVNVLKEKVLPVMYPRSDSPKGSPKADNDITYVRASDSESDSDDSVVFIEDVSKQIKDGTNLSSDFFDHETPPISPRRFYRMDIRSVAPDFFDRRRTPVPPQKLCRIDYKKDVPPDFCDQKTPPVSPIKIRIQQRSNSTIQNQQYTSLKKPIFNYSNSLIVPCKPMPVWKTVEIRLKRIDESILEQYKHTSEVSKFAYSEDSSLMGGTKNKEQMIRKTTKRKSSLCTKTDLLPQQTLNRHDQNFQPREISFTGESSLQDTRLMRVTMDIPYSKILELEHLEKRSENIAVWSKVNEDKFGSSVTHIAKSKERKVSLSERPMLSLNVTEKYSIREGIDHKEKQRNLKKTDKTHPAHKMMQNTRRKENKSMTNREENYSMRDCNKVRCELCTKRVSGLVDHIISEHGVQLA